LAKLGSFEKKTILVLLRIQTRLMMGIVKNRKSILENNTQKITTENILKIIKENMMRYSTKILKQKVLHFFLIVHKSMHEICIVLKCKSSPP